METYIFKIILCSSLLICLYYLFLEKERTFKFNRFYLIFALAFSYLIPFLSLKFPQTQKTQTALIFQDAGSEIIISKIPVESTFNWTLMVISVYGLITIFLLVKSVFSVIKILKLKGKLIKIENQKIKILEENLSPFSFFGTLYLGKKYFKNGKIDDRIYLHEKNHIDQKHSLDLLFIEILKIFTWFNPALYFYKKAIITNHEFLADENVLAKKFEIKPYQQLILEEISTYQNRTFTNQFNFNNTKKRFIMMTKPNSKFAVIKKIFAIFIFGISACLFAKKVYSRNTEKQPENKITSVKISKSNPEFSPLKSEILKIKSDTIKKPIKVQKQKVNKGTLVAETEMAPPPPPPPPSVTQQIPAEFPGGLNALRSSAAKFFDASIFNGDESLMKTTIFFRIDETGKVTEYFKSDGNNEKFNAEAINSLKKANDGVMWKPALHDGKAVSSVYRMPMTMKFEK
ncbi:M56 family metallopeptidase [Halpernia frigidisoli]|uniref:BlaR1 peptidase M56 n=1 Tax=Halpernia frigidisoli TaxID=1125876 RepID=A0A1I3HLX9_9FLAO|nr:M56 family metallopeptidase [Halpernia frigidisoli]SFI36619.1 BlaR1 peptidase M56 [Halpernia frigidisoli]